MKKLLLLLGTAMISLYSYSQKGIGFPSKKWGIGFGQPNSKFSGIRLNFIDPVPYNDDRIRTTNGVFIGGSSFLDKLHGISLSGLALSNEWKGLSISALGQFGESMRGVTINGLFTIVSHDLTGVQISGLFIMSNAIKGLGMAPIIVTPFDDKSGVISKGVLIGGCNIIGGGQHGIIVDLFNYTQESYGVQIGIINMINTGLRYEDPLVLKGFSIAICNAIEGEQYGVTVGLMNYTRRIRGIQLGLINIVKENPRGLRVLPFFNTRFGKGKLKRKRNSLL